MVYRVLKEVTEENIKQRCLRILVKNLIEMYKLIMEGIQKERTKCSSGEDDVNDVHGRILREEKRCQKKMD